MILDRSIDGSMKCLVKSIKFIGEFLFQVIVQLNMWVKLILPFLDNNIFNIKFGESRTLKGK